MTKQSLLKTDLKCLHPNRVQPHVWCSQIDAKRFALCSIRKPITYLCITFDLRNSTKNHHLSLVCGAFLEHIVHNHPLLLIGHYDRLKVDLSNGKEERDGFVSHPPWNNSCVCYLTLLMSAEVDRMVSLKLSWQCIVESAPNLWCGLLPVAHLWCPPQGWSGLLVLGTHILSYSHTCLQGSIWSHPILSSLFSLMSWSPGCVRKTQTLHRLWGRCKHVTWREALSWAVNNDNQFVFKIRPLHCTPLEFRTGFLAGVF